jgi:hypothetical protein
MLLSVLVFVLVLTTSCKSCCDSCRGLRTAQKKSMLVTKKRLFCLGMPQSIEKAREKSASLANGSTS